MIIIVLSKHVRQATSNLSINWGSWGGMPWSKRKFGLHWIVLLQASCCYTYSKHDPFPGRENSSAFVNVFTQMASQLGFCPHYKTQICFAANKTHFFLSYQLPMDHHPPCDKLMHWKSDVVPLVISLKKEASQSLPPFFICSFHIC